jgi:hypothetical protein
MGRWAHFNTGFEYKFWFAVQDSGFGFLEDIIRFHDRTTYRIDDDYETECDCPIQQQINEEFKAWALIQETLSPDATGFQPEWADNMTLCESDSQRYCVFDTTEQNKSNLLNWIMRDWITENEKYLPDFTKYSSDAEGTEALCKDLSDHEFFKSADDKDSANYMLALLLYHQMTYCDDLSCDYEC